MVSISLSMEYKMLTSKEGSNLRVFIHTDHWFQDVFIRHLLYCHCLDYIFNNLDSSEPSQVYVNYPMPASGTMDCDDEWSYSCKWVNVGHCKTRIWQCYKAFERREKSYVTIL